MLAQAPVNLVNVVNPEIYASFCLRNFSLDFFLFFHSVRRFLNTAKIPSIQIPKNSKQLPHSPMFDVLQGIRAASTFMAKTLNHGLTQVILENHAGAYVFSTRGGSLPRHPPLHHLRLYQPSWKAAAFFPHRDKPEAPFPRRRPDIVQEDGISQERAQAQKFQKVNLYVFTDTKGTNFFQQTQEKRRRAIILPCVCRSRQLFVIDVFVRHSLIRFKYP